MDNSLHDALRQTCLESGIVYRDVPSDGRWHDADIDGDAHGKGDARIKLFLDGRGGHVQNWKTGEFKTFFTDDNRVLTNEERIERDRQRHESQAKAQEELAKGRNRAALKAKKLWKAGTPTTADHPYLVRKSVQPTETLRELDVITVTQIIGYAPKANGELLAGRILIAPVKIVGKGFVTCELIDEEGRKSALAGGEKAGGYWVTRIYKDGPIAISEGVSTALSISAATHWPCVAALSCKNLPAVGKAIKALYPAAPIVVCGDLGNGQQDAEVAALAVGGCCVIPNFTEEDVAAFVAKTGKKPTDFNDLAVIRGLSAVSDTVKKSSYVRETDNPSHSAQSMTYSVPNPSLTRPYPSHKKAPQSESIISGGLLFSDDKGLHRVIESDAAETVAGLLRAKLGWDHLAQSWLLWKGSHWEVQDVAAPAEKILADAVHVGCADLGFRPNYLEGINTLIKRRNLLPPPLPESIEKTIPFLNGLLSIETKELTSATPERAHYWCLPHEYNPMADCPTIKSWLLRSVDGDQQTVELLRAWMAALVRGVELQNILLLIGPGGTGKGTFQRLVTELIGVRNIAVTTLRDLEENRFEAAKLYGRRLAMVNEAGKHGGSINVLKAITGGDHISIERKHVQQTGSFIFHGLVLMASNDQLQTTDRTSGIERRRITVEFKRRATVSEKNEWLKLGGEDKVLHNEIPGLINWILELSVEEIRARIEELPKRIKVSNLLGLAAGNSVADWLIESCIPEPDSWSQIGDKRELRDPLDGRVSYENAQVWLYPNYLTWSRRAGRDKTVSLRVFREVIEDISEKLGYPVTPKRENETRNRGLSGIRLRIDNEEQYQWGTDLSKRTGQDGSGTGQAIDWAERTGDSQLLPQTFTEKNTRTNEAGRVIGGTKFQACLGGQPLDVTNYPPRSARNVAVEDCHHHAGSKSRHGSLPVGYEVVVA